jgi:hypothetical protein
MQQPVVSSSLDPSDSDFLFLKTMNENAERINGLAAMLGVVAAMGAYALTGQIIPGIW